MTNTELASGGPQSQDDEDEISLLDLAIAVGEEKLTIGGTALAGALVALLISLFLPTLYTASTLLLPPQGSQGASSAALAALGALSAMGGAVGGVKTPDELYVGLLKSRSVTDALIDHFQLQQRYGEKYLSDTRKTLESRVDITSDKKSGLLQVEVDDRDPAFAAELANAHVTELRQLMTRVAVTDAQQRRAYFEQQVARSKEELAKAELDFARAQEKSGMLSLDVAAQSSIRAAAELRARIVALEIELRSMSSYTASGNPDVLRLGSELASLRAQLAKVEQGDRSLPHLSDAAMSNVRAYRELKYQEAVVASMVAQYEAARADEARDAPLIQQVDVAVAPDRKSRPRRTMITALGLVCGLLLGTVYAFLRRSVSLVSGDPASGVQIIRLRRAWSLRRAGAAVPGRPTR